MAAAAPACISVEIDNAAPRVDGVEVERRRDARHHDAVDAAVVRENNANVTQARGRLLRLRVRPRHEEGPVRGHRRYPGRRHGPRQDLTIDNTDVLAPEEQGRVRQAARKKMYSSMSLLTSEELGGRVREVDQLEGPRQERARRVHGVI